MRRAHNGKEALHAASIIKQSSFSNFSFDLIIGQIHQDLTMLGQDLRHLESFKPPHLSTYLLTVEEKTHLHKEIQRKRLPDVADRTQEEHYLHLMEWARGGDMHIMKHRVSHSTVITPDTTQLLEPQSLSRHRTKCSFL